MRSRFFALLALSCFQASMGVIFNLEVRMDPSQVIPPVEAKVKMYSTNSLRSREDDHYRLSGLSAGVIS